MRRVQFNLTGFVGLKKTDEVPVLRVNFENVEEACVFHTLQVATAAEVAKIESGADEEGVVHDMLGELPRIHKAGGMSAVRQVLQKAVLFTAPIPALMQKHDVEDVVFTGEFEDEDTAVEALVAAADLQKAAFDFTLQTTESVVQFLRALVKAGEASEWTCQSEGARLRVALKGATSETLGPVVGAVLNVVPQKKSAEPVTKVSFEPFKTVSDFAEAINAAVAKLVYAGAFGMAQYRVDSGELEEMAPRWWYVCEIGNGWLVVNVELGEAEEREASYRVKYVVSEAGMVEISEPFERVFREGVWVREDEVATVRPVAEGEPPATVQDTEPESTDEASTAEVEASAKKPYGVPTQKFCVVKTDLRQAAEDAAEKRYVLGVVLEPNDGTDGPLNPDTQGDVYSAADIEKAAHKWMSEFLNVGLMHVELAGRRIVPVESFIAPVDMQLGDQKVQKGAWLLGAIIEDPNLWKAVKDGQLTGWSMGGFAVREPL